eukprot:Anaeramoba_flamelloidesa327141_154.p3 GENE.a327141_154~~a327141_154.p3  ORF type:complete len:190 (+),score=16.59 a327141_154:752-1321(+)
MKKRNLVIGLLVTLAVALTGATFAFWASGITGNNDTEAVTIAVGEGEAVTTTVAVTSASSSALPLVPDSRDDDGTTTVGSVTFTFDVVWAGTSSATDTAGATGDLVMTTPVLTGLQSDGLTPLDAPELGLFTVTTSYVATPSVTYGSTTQITVTVTFTTEPANQAQYDLVADSDLSLSVTFTVNNVSAA